MRPARRSTQTAAVVGVLCCNRDLDGRAAQAVASRFVAPVAEHAGATVLLVPAIPDAVDVIGVSRLLDVIDGVAIDEDREARVVRNPVVGFEKDPSRFDH